LQYLMNLMQLGGVDNFSSVKSPGPHGHDDETM
jgi:hypothetical protein